MKRNEFKNILKPLIKECIKEVLFEEGVLSGIITEVVNGTQRTNLRENLSPRPQENRNPQQINLEKKENTRKLYEEELKRRKKLLNATGLSADIFEGTEPLSSPGSINESANSLQGPLAGIASDDAGIDISGISSIGSGHNWKKLARGK